jgi:hypothetical protein
MNEDMVRLLEEGVLTIPFAEKYLSIYVGDAKPSWEYHILNVFLKRMQKKYNGDELKAVMKESISLTILLPSIDRSTKIELLHPENNLFWSQGSSLYGTQNWFKKLQKVVTRDVQIKEWRRMSLRLGFIDPIDYQPYTRQAFNWLFSKAEDSGVVTDANKQQIIDNFRTMVWVYGGAVISYIFTNHPEVLNKVTNWRTGYFFERTIFDVYTPEQVFKIKETELRKTPNKYIKKIAD